MSNNTRYPIDKATNIPGSGNAFYLYLMDNVNVPAKMAHTLWYNGMMKLKEDPTNPFQGFYPVGKTLKVAYDTNAYENYTFTGEEKNPIFVKDLAPETIKALGISEDANPNTKVFNPYFRPYEDLPAKKKKDNELPTLSMAKTVGHFLASKNILFTEKDIVDMLMTAVYHCDSKEMMFLLHGNHVSWCAARFMESGVMEADIKKQFFGQNEIEFYIKDIGTIMPSILFALAALGVDPVGVIPHIQYDLYGIKETAEDLRKIMNPKALDRTPLQVGV